MIGLIGQRATPWLQRGGQTCHRPWNIRSWRGRWWTIQIKLAEILSTNRSRNIVIPRQIAMYLAKEYTKHSFLDIARAFKKKDHTTVIHAVKKIKALYNKNSTVRNDINLLIRQIDH